MSVRKAALATLALLAACQRAPEPSPGNVVATATPAPVATPSVPAADLSRYVGHYPTDEVTGATFLDDAAVRDAVAAAVPDAAVRARVLDRDVVATPIVLEDGRILSHGCEPHNCGAHDWTIVMTPDGARAGVCYSDQDRGVARWYPQGFAADPVGGCPAGAGND